MEPITEVAPTLTGEQSLKQRMSYLHQFLADNKYVLKDPKQGDKWRWNLDTNDPDFPEVKISFTAHGDSSQTMVSWSNARLNSLGVEIGGIRYFVKNGKTSFEYELLSILSGRASSHWQKVEGAGLDAGQIHLVEELLKKTAISLSKEI